MEAIQKLLNDVLNKEFVQAILSNPRKKDGVLKIKVRPVEMRGKRIYQLESFTKTQAFHENLETEQAAERILSHMEEFRQMQLDSGNMEYTVLVSKKGKVTIQKHQAKGGKKQADLSHNRSKKYILKEEMCIRDRHYENRKESVDIMIRSSQEIIRQLVGYGVDFEKKDGDFTFTREGAHSRPRILFHEDVTGKEITSKLLEQVKALKNVTLYEYTTMTDLLIDDGICKGIKAVRRNEDGSGETEELEIYGENTILSLIHI